MLVQQTIRGIGVVTLLFCSTLGRAETAAELFTKGETHLVKGAFTEALQAYAAAARNDQSNSEYMQHYAIVRRIIDLRNRLESEKDPQRWEYMARALRAFYTSEQIYPELLKLDQEIHSRLNSAESAAMLGETLLSMDRNAEAAKALAGVESGKTTPMTEALLGIALARTGRTDQAKQIAKQLSLPNEAGPNLNYAAARLYAGTGDSAKAIELLKGCFESTLPSQLDGFKMHAKTCQEFAAMTSTPDFVGVMKTESKVPESKCSGGKSCAGCPMSGKCPKSQAKE